MKNGTSPNYINHIALVMDASSSMTVHSAAVVKVADNLVAHLAERSRHWDQETRITTYAFSSEHYLDGDWVKCLIYDKDVLRVPSIAGQYRAHGNTALMDATALAIDDLALTPEKYGEHAFLIYVLTDGQENKSHLITGGGLKAKIAGLPAHWTLAAFVPDQYGIFEARKYGFPEDNIAVWNTASVTGVEEVGETIRQVSEAFMEGRTRGVRGYSAPGRGLFRMNAVSAADVKGSLIPLTKGSYEIFESPCDHRIDDFVQAVTRRPYSAGMAYYEFDGKLKPSEIIQATKQLAVETGGQLYSGRAARQMLGLPDYQVRVKPADHPGCTIFVQSTSFNRKILAGQRVLVMR